MRKNGTKFDLYTKILSSGRQNAFAKLRKNRIKKSIPHKFLSSNTDPDDPNQTPKSKFLSQVKLPKIKFSLTSAPKTTIFSSHNFSSVFDEMKENTLSPSASSKLSNIYEFISQFKSSIQSPKIDSPELLPIKLTDQSREFFRQIRLTQESLVFSMLKSNPRLVNIKDSVGKTPLHWAVIRNSLSISSFLMSFGADPNVKDYSNRSAKDLALQLDFPKLYQLLLR